jgi:hypothetical protein
LTDAACFYSSLAQVTAAVVAFLGGFLLLRLQDYERYWQDILVRPRVNQARWSQDKDLQPNASFSWNELVRAVDEQRQAAVPGHILSGGCLAVMFLVGSIAPLFALGEPDDSAKAWFLIPTALLVLVFVAIAFLRSRATLATVKAFELWPYVEGEYIEWEMQNEAWAAKEAWEKDERRKQRAATADASDDGAAVDDSDAGRPDA